MRRFIVAVLTTALLFAGVGSALAGPGGKNETCPPTSNNPEGTPPDCGNQHPGKTANKTIDEAQAVFNQTVLALVTEGTAVIDGTQQVVTYALTTDSFAEQQTMTLIDGMQEVALILPPVPPVCSGCTPETDALYQTLYLAYYETTQSGIDGGQDEVALILPPVPPVCSGCEPVITSTVDTLQTELEGATLTSLATFNATLDAAQGQL